jgi:hypothetical protein
MKTLTSLIREHNYLNGFRFVVTEFIISIIIVLPFTVYYLFHHRILFGIVGLGVIVNFSIYILFSIQSIRREEESIGIGKLFNKKIRAEIRNKYPNLDKLTWILTITTIVPFAMTTIVLLEAINRNK